MDLSVFLAQVIGLYMLIVGLVALKDPGLQGVLNEISKDRDTRFVLGLFTLIIGLLLVVSHNIWSGPGYQVLITLISWIALIKGFLAVWLKDESYKRIVARFNTKTMLTVGGVINLIVGIYLTYVGFFI